AETTVELTPIHFRHCQVENDSRWFLAATLEFGKRFLGRGERCDFEAIRSEHEAGQAVEGEVVVDNYDVMAHSGGIVLVLGIRRKFRLPEHSLQFRYPTWPS